jgi:hypothetical protein
VFFVEPLVWKSATLKLESKYEKLIELNMVLASSYSSALGSKVQKIQLQLQLQEKS